MERKDIYYITKGMVTPVIEFDNNGEEHISIVISQEVGHERDGGVVHIGNKDDYINILENLNDVLRYFERRIKEENL